MVQNHHSVDRQQDQDYMRVLHFFKTALPDTMGGVEQVIDQIARGVVKHGVQSDVLSLTPHKVPRTIALNGYQAHRAQLDFHIASTGFSLSAIFRFAQLAKTADVIHYHFPWPFMDLVHLIARVKKPTIVTYHSDIVRQKKLLKIYRPLRDAFLGDVSAIVATSPNYLSTSQVLTKFKQKVCVIPIGLDKATYPEPTEDNLQQWRDRVGAKFFLFVGVIRYYKGLHILIEAAKGVDYPIVIVGAGPIELELRKQVEMLRLTNIHFLGQLSDVDKVALIKLSYGVVFPSHLRSEAFGISLLEGAMYGKPMISSEIGTGTSYINIDKETGLVIPPSDPNELREAMRYLWNNPQVAESMGAQALKRYREHFTAEKMAIEYVSLYKQISR